MPDLGVGIVGAGRIGALHAELISRRVPGAAVVAVSDVRAEAAEALAGAVGAESVTLSELIDHPGVDIVAVCSSTDTHVEVVERAILAGRAIFCEKPLSMDLDEVDRIIAMVEEHRTPFMMGFNRRFDPGHRSVRQAVVAGQVGEPHIVRITSRDPEPPPLDYIRASGGLWVDMMIHDLDMATYLVDSPVRTVYAVGAVRVDPAIGEAGDVDTAVVVLTHEDGTVTTIDNSRRATYGYDQRVEVFGSRGMATSGNRVLHEGSLHTEAGSVSQPLQHFFLDRYLDSYAREWEAFLEYLREGGESPAPVASARTSVVLAEAAATSARTGQPVVLPDARSGSPR